MRIVAAPAWRNRRDNPYTSLLYDNMPAEVEEFSFLRALMCDYSILHVHWPEYYVNRRPAAYTAARWQAFLALLSWIRRRGVKVIWTVHNLRPHESFHSSLQPQLWDRFTAQVDGYISLSHSGMEATKRCFTRFHAVPGFVIPHGHYRGEYPTSKEDIRRVLGIPRDSKIALFFGMVRQYKNIPRLIESFRAVPDGDCHLVIAGAPFSRQLKNEIAAHASGDGRIHLCLQRIERERVQAFFDAADLVVLPYSEVLNSGTAILALSFNRPVLVPLKGAMGELAEQAGEPWVTCYQGEIDAARLHRALIAAAARRSDGQEVHLDRLNWERLAAETLQAYRTVLQQPVAALM